MKNKFKFVLFSLVFVLFTPIIFSACNEKGFEDIPYLYSEAIAEDVIRDFNSSGEDIVKKYSLRVSYETINTYTFYDVNSSQNNTVKKIVKDVITTTLGKNDVDSTEAIINTSRFVNDKFEYSLTNTYAKTITPNLSYCYSLYINNSGEEEVSDKDRNEYDSTPQTKVDFFNSCIYQIGQDEIEGILQKEFEGITYYKLVSGVDTLEKVNDRFTEDENLFNNPQLFKIQTKAHHDSVENYYYECAKNSSDYATYYSLNYNIFNSDSKRYLNVSSVSRLKAFGDSVTLGLPEDVNEYTANSFMKTMQKEDSYVVYSQTKNGGENSDVRTTWSVAKIGNDYSVVQDQYQGNAISSTFYYYLVSNNQGEYTAYQVDKTNKTIRQQPEFLLDLLNFDFTQALVLKDDNNYQFGTDATYTIVSLENDEVESIKTKIKVNNKDEELVLFIDSYGKKYSSLPTRFVTSIEGYSIIA